MFGPWVAGGCRHAGSGRQDGIVRWRCRRMFPERGHVATDLLYSPDRMSLQMRFQTGVWRRNTECQDCRATNDC